MKVGRNNIDRKVVSLKDFRGVDYASSPLEVKPYRATDMANLLLRDGQLQKRYGFRQYYQENDFFGFPFRERVYSVSAYKCGKNIIVAYGDATEGYMTFIKTYARNRYGVFEMVNEIYVASLLSEATGVYENEYFYLFWRYGIKRTKDGLTWEDINPYTPTTTINIPLRQYYGDFSNIKENYYVDGDVTYPNESNESLNILTNERRNKLLLKADPRYDNFQGIGVAGTVTYFKLDGLAKMPISAEDTSTKKPILTVKFNGEDRTIAEFSPVSNEEDVYWASGIFEIRNNVKSDDLGRFKHDTSSILAITGTVSDLTTLLADADVSEFGYIDLTLRFSADIPDESHIIYQGSTAANFGVNGADDRIFVASGNRVYISENTSHIEADASYFPVNQWVECGYGSSPITAMMRVSDGTLAVFKDVSAQDDVAVYYVSGYYESTGVGAEGNEYQRAKFTVKAGDIRRTGISAKSVANLEGDNIFTSKEGVYGIQLSDNVASGERYARERSRTINPKITQFPLENAKGIVYKDKYFLAVGNGEVYVADARYTFTLQGDQQNTFNYEWFRLTGLNVLEWFVFEDKLHFIDKDGYFCEFTEGFADQYLVTTDNNELAVNDNGTVTFNKEERLSLVKASSYAVDGAGNTWQLTLTEDESAILIPEGITIADADDLDLWFCVPIAAYWQSAVMDLNSPMYLKNMWSLSMVASAKHGGKINLGYKTRMNAVNNIEVEGANKFEWGEAIDMFGGLQTSMLTGNSTEFGMYTFDVGGYVGINTYTRRIFERNFAHIQLLFTSETTTDCAVSEMDIEYSIAKKNIGVG